MGDSIKRMRWASDGDTLVRVEFYAFQKANMVLNNQANETDASKTLAQRVYSRAANFRAMALLCTVNETIGALIDAGSPVEEGSIQWVILTGEWANMAASGV